ncbi:MAG: hypothetical protein ACLSE4_02200 [Clostridium sp.]
MDQKGIIIASTEKHRIGGFPSGELRRFWQPRA